MTAILESSATGIDERTADLLFRAARTAYAFDGTPVSDEQLEHIYDLVRFAPTGMNSQPLRIAFVRSEEGKARLLPLLAPGNRKKASSAPVVAILAADTDFHKHLPRLMPHAPRTKERFAGDDAARVETATFNATMQAGYFILAVRAAGLDAGPMGGIDNAAIDAEFFAGTGLRTFLAVNIGTIAPGGTYPRAPRLEFHEAVTTV